MRGESAGHCQQCKTCSNFMNWQHVHTDLWRCLNCGTLSDGRTRLDKTDFSIAYDESVKHAREAMAKFRFERNWGWRRGEKLWQTDPYELRSSRK